MDKPDFFCPAPWTGMYFHENSVGPCHASLRLQKMSPTEYLQSDWLKNIKQELKSGIVPLNCATCFNKEKRGLKSTREASRKGARGNPIKFPNGMVDPSKFLVEDPIALDRLELRTSNLCNFKCRMCNAASSSEWQREDEEYGNKRIVGQESKESFVTSDYNFEELKKLSLDNINTVCFTGGEPLLIKQYYDYMDHMIETGANKTVMLELYSNCSVWNPLFIDRLLKFRRARFVMSIDGVDKVAEYNRKGTKWDVVRENIFKFAKLPIHQLHYNVAISPYNLLDFANLAKFLMQVYETNNGLQTRCYSVTVPYQLHWVHLNQDLRDRVINEIDQSLEILIPSNFDVLKKELIAIKTHMLKTNPEKPELFVSYTKNLDSIRNEKFEDVYGYKLY